VNLRRDKKYHDTNLDFLLWRISYKRFFFVVEHKKKKERMIFKNNKEESQKLLLWNEYIMRLD